MKTGSLIFSIFLLFTLTANAQTQVHRCSHENGVAFSDQPCEVGSKATKKTYVGSGPSGVLDLRVEPIHYDVSGLDRNSLLRSLSAKGPRGFHGLAQWKVNYAYTSKRQVALCQIDKVTLTVVGQILMPNWIDKQGADAGLRQRWDSYYRALKHHEDGHIDHGRELALKVRERLMGLGAVPCEQLGSRARSEFDRIYKNLKSRDKDYDARTSHGAGQGVRL